jgi:pimeloyl-ACP methyl ester carboxylesterase
MKWDSSDFPEWDEGGNQERSALVLLHGFTGTWRQFKPLLPMLEPHHRVIVPTLPGHVGGLPLKKRASPVSIAKTLAEQLKAHGIHDAHFVGGTLGGWACHLQARGLTKPTRSTSCAGAAPR